MLLEARDLHVAYGDIQAVNGVDFNLEAGELVSIIGANGAGKTSILNGLMGLTPLRSGVIRFKGSDISPLPAFRRARAGIRMVPERARSQPPPSPEGSSSSWPLPEPWFPTRSC